MPLVQGSSRQAISENIRRERDAHKPLKQAIAIAMDVARRNRYAEGGSAVRQNNQDEYGNTLLAPLDEMAFRGWVKDNSIPFQPSEPKTDYDMRGYWQALQQQHPRAVSSVNSADNRLHYPDYWKTPLHETFSNESRGAPPDAPRWVGNRLISPGGRVLFDEETKANLSPFMAALARRNRAEGGRADEKTKLPMPRPNPFRQSQAPPRIADAFGRLPPSYGNLERQMGNPELDRVMLGLDKINHPPLRPTMQQDLDKYWAGRGEFYRTINRLKMDPAAVDRMPQSTNIEYRWPVTADDLYGDHAIREPLGAIRNYASGGRAGQVIQRAGLITSTVPGRTDKHSINVLSGSYILPADHVAHLGQDNSMAGGRVLDSMFAANRKSPPASGDIVPIVVAGGEYLLEPDQVESVGNGNLTRGHNALDAWVKSARKKHVALLKSLPPPKTK